MTFSLRVASTWTGRNLAIVFDNHKSSKTVSREGMGGGAKYTCPNQQQWSKSLFLFLTSAILLYSKTLPQHIYNIAT